MMKANFTRLTLPLPFILGLLAMTTSISLDMLVPGITQISNDFLISIDRAENIISIFLIGFAVGQLIFGPVADRIGRRPIFIGGILFFLISNWGAATCNQFTALLSFRLLQGFGAAAISVAINASLRDSYTNNALSRIISLVTLVMTIAPLIGPTLGGYLIINFGWRAILWVCTGFSFICLFVVLVGLPETLKKEQQQSIQWRSVTANYWEIISQSKIWGYILINSFSFAAMFVFITVSADLYINTFHIPIQYFGLVYSINIAAMFLMSALNGKYVSSIGYKKMLFIGMSIQIAAVALLVANVMMGLGLLSLVTSIALLVGCVPLISSNSMTGILSDFPNLAGTASSVAGCIRFGLSALAGLLVSMLTMTSSLIAMLIVICCCMVLMIASYGLIKTGQVANEEIELLSCNE